MHHHQSLSNPKKIIRRLGQLLAISLLLGLGLTAHPTQAQGNAPLPDTPETLTGDVETWSLAWGDVDNDGDLDLAVGNGDGPNKLYLNFGGELAAMADQSFGDTDDTRSVAWGDVDNDGDLDLAVGNFGGPNRIYLNQNGLLKAGPVLGKNENTRSVAWGDADRDGDLDLAVGNKDAPNQLYLNNKGALQTTPLVFGGVEDSRSLAWGDTENNGDLTLAVGNFAAANDLYRYQGGLMKKVQAFSLSTSNTTSVAWGDVDNDGDLDLAVGNHNQPNEVYTYEKGLLQTTAPWNSNDTDQTWSVAWADLDADGYLDLTAGNGGGVVTGQEKIYHNMSGILDNSAPWVSGAKGNSRSLAWGDVDGDGDLDLAVGNFEEANTLYRNLGQSLQTVAGWASTATEQSFSLAWGDVDGDGDLDLAVGNWNARNQLYLNSGGALPLAASQLFGPAGDNTAAVAWGDVDGDGDLDLAVGNAGGPNRLYRNDNGALVPSGQILDSGGNTDDTSSLAWGDVDGDGDLDLAAGNKGAANRLYRNDNDSLDSGTPFGDSGDDTASIAWGDVDNDGDLDLAAGLGGAANKLYRNDGGTLVEAATFGSNTDDTASLAWGDVDGDGDLDLAAGTYGGVNRLYRNDHGVLVDLPVFTTSDDTRSLAWGDVDGDGDLDLAVGNETDRNKVYFNRGGNLQTANPWLSEVTSTRDLAWGDVDGDGDLDLAAANSHPTLTGLRQNKLYLNLARQNDTPQNEPAYATLGRPDATDAAFFFSTPDILTASAGLPVTYTLFDPEGHPASRIYPEFSPNGGGQWLPATPGSGGDGLTRLAASPGGTAHTFVWKAEADLIKSDNVLFRLRVHAGPTYSPILWPDQGSHSPSFRLEAPFFVRVVGANGQPAAGAEVYTTDQRLDQTVTGDAVTDAAGLLNPGPLPAGTPLVALALQAEQPSLRDHHDGWAYRTYLTNLAIDATGNITPFTVNSTSGEQRLVVQPDQTLILFNLLISVEWDAEEAYLQDVAEAMKSAADFLYDVSDGQMSFGQVAIYDQAVHWAEADIQISAKNVVQPHAVVGGLLEPGNAHLIRVGRSWDGNTANQGSWSAADGYRTLVHEFGHYALGLYDEYFGYELINGELAGRKEAYCLNPTNREVAGEATNASIMDYHYTSSELADVSQWNLPTAWCRETAQHLLNNGEADWQTLQRLFGDSKNRWQLLGPDARAGANQVVAGPAQLPATLPFPSMTYTNAGADPLPFAVQVCRNGELYLAGAWITLVSSGGQAIDQGLTGDGDGSLTILGAGPDDTLQVVSLDGTLSASKRAGLAQFDGFINLVTGGSLNATATRALNERRQTVTFDRAQMLFSSDGNLSLFLPQGVLAQEGVEMVVATPGALPGPLPAGLALAGPVYHLTASTGEVQLAKPALLSLHYDAALGRRFAPDSLAIYRWETAPNQWQPLPNQATEERQVVSSPIRELGLYALLGPPQTVAARSSSAVCSSAAGAIEQLYLPLVLK